MKKILLASGNQGKLKELQNAFDDLPVKLIPQPNSAEYEVAETGTTFIENAIIKARHAARLSGLPAIADDSGLIVDALDGAPGVITARYAGSHASSGDNMTKLLNRMQGITDRSARFYCVLVYLKHHQDPTPIICEGSWEGSIAEKKSGQEGFGYDPIFFIRELNKTSAELDKSEKLEVSHRGKAVKQLQRMLKQEINSL